MTHIQFICNIRDVILQARIDLEMRWMLALEAARKRSCERYTALILRRSPQTVERMEAERGLK